MKKLLFLFMCAGLLTGCSDDDNGPDSRLDDNWTMIGYVAYMETLPQLEPNEIIWRIDLDGRKLTVTNLVEEEYPYIQASGTYDIRVTNNRFIIEEGEYDSEYDYSFENGELILNSNIDGLVDGPIMHFEKTDQGELIID